ncbi:MAG: hypothetical protein MZW92_66075 [Comamonadaceae bacterium]|nr:hypothetical protein [Comamonadaceae bacterium]
MVELLRHDEHVIPLKTRIEELERDAVSLLASVAPARPDVTPTVPVHPVPPLPVTPPAAKIVVEERQQADLRRDLGKRAAGPVEGQAGPGCRTGTDPPLAAAAQGGERMIGAQQAGASAASLVSTAQIAAQLDAVLDRDPHATAIAIRAASQGAWPRTMERRGRRFRVRWCESRLGASRGADRHRRRGPGRRGRGGDDPVGGHRCARRRGGTARARAAVPAQGLGHPAPALRGNGNRCTARAARLDAGTADRDHRGRPGEPGAGRLSRSGHRVARGAGALPGPGQRAARSRDVDALGAARGCFGAARQDAAEGTVATRCNGWPARPGRRASWSCVASTTGRGADAASLGVVCELLFAQRASGVAALGHATVRLERHVGNQHVGVQEGRELGASASRRDYSSIQLRAKCARSSSRADALLADLMVGEHAHRSDWLPRGLEQRMSAFAGSAAGPRPTAGRDPSPGGGSCGGRGALTTGSSAGGLCVRNGSEWRSGWPAGSCARHRLVARRPSRWRHRPTMRRSPTGRGSSCWAATSCLTFLRPTRSCARRCRCAAKLPTCAFAAALAANLKQNVAVGERVVPVERALESVVAPLAASHPVLVLVIDGMSLAVFRELFERPEDQGWIELVPDASDRPRCWGWRRCRRSPR